MPTIFEPNATGLSVYVIFNCDINFGEFFSILREKDKVNIGISKDYGGKEPAGRFSWDEVIPVKVSENPKILLNGRDHKVAESYFTQDTWEDVFKFIKRNKKTIQQHWDGEIDDLELHERFI